MMHTSYGFDVLALVGQLRFKQHMIIAEITEEFAERGVSTSERNSQGVYERYLTLLRSSVTEFVKDILNPAEDQSSVCIRVGPSG
ncbi:hypothetical protein [Paenibacillus roseipurpureus]|uniref:Uncharacterized protein n=1 Tax=Paenibacillus roseopurpureus TaxID=2918901 RepID=A0AA96LJA4_9BACL|nr:hypothetical protein [Paenibacillus sp. MBLB1832]WNR42902.1 hypothetical protein MJB10_17480 [Paenibacillus sp. MBLB1832]